MAEEKEAKDQKKTITIRVPSFNFWTVTTLVLAVALIFVLVSGVGFTGMMASLNIPAGADANTVAQKTVEYINKNLVQTGSVTFKSVSEENGLYNVTTDYNGQAISVFVSKDGKLLFVSSPFDMTKEITQAEETTPQEITKTDKPTVELFVMSFCPYGVQAEQTMKPVIDLLGSKADIKVRFIVTVNGDTIDKIQSLHGTTEAQEDARQLCIAKNYDQATFWKYLMEIDSNCYGKITTSDAAALDTCWKAAADKAGIDKDKIATCASGAEAITLLKAEQAAADKYGVSGSPTLVINGVTYSGSRTPDAFKTAICGAFNTQPSECSQTLTSTSSTSAAASGGC